MQALFWFQLTVQDEESEPATQKAKRQLEMTYTDKTRYARSLRTFA